MGWRQRRTERLLAKVAREREAHNLAHRTPMHLLDPLVAELVRIGERGAFLDDPRVVEIGRAIDHRGGMRAMRGAHEQVSYWCPSRARALEMAWDGIGDWMG
jgi:hypothetical protein